MSRVIVLVSILLGLSGCITARQGDDATPQKLQSEGTGIVLMHSSLHQGCSMIESTLVRKDASGQWVQTQKPMLKGAADIRMIPSQIVLPAGGWGFVQLICGRNHYGGGRMVKRGDIWDNTGAIWDKPFATFTVNAGEVVNIGSLRLPSRTIQDKERGGTRNVFIGVVTATPAEWLENLAKVSPDIYNARVTRHMNAAIKI